MVIHRMDLVPKLRERVAAVALLGVSARDYVPKCPLSQKKPLVSDEGALFT